VRNGAAVTPSGSLRLRPGDRALLLVAPEDVAGKRRSSMRALGTPSEDVLKQRGTVVIEWSETSTDEDTELVEDCRRG
jgi:hypothetical protein